MRLWQRVLLFRMEVRLRRDVRRWRRRLLEAEAEMYRYWRHHQ